MTNDQSDGGLGLSMRWRATAAAMVMAIASGGVGCGGSGGVGFGGGDAAGGGATADSGAFTAPPGFDDDGGVVLAAGDAGSAGACKGGLYTGTFAGNYTSSLTVIGFPVPVKGNLSMNLAETQSGSEFPVYTIQDGVISGLVYNLYPFRCTMVGTLDCSAAKLVGGGVSCEYCVGPAPGSFEDGGTCARPGYFQGPLDANYDVSTYTFVDGTWNGVDEASPIDAGPDADFHGNDSGVYLGPGNYGGSGTWGAALGDGGI